MRGWGAAHSLGCLRATGVCKEPDTTQYYRNRTHDSNLFSDFLVAAQYMLTFPEPPRLFTWGLEGLGRGALYYIRSLC